MCSPASVSFCDLVRSAPPKEHTRIVDRATGSCEQPSGKLAPRCDGFANVGFREAVPDAPALANDRNRRTAVCAPATAQRQQLPHYGHHLDNVSRYVHAGKAVIHSMIVWPAPNLPWICRIGSDAGVPCNDRKIGSCLGWARSLHDIERDDRLGEALEGERSDFFERRHLLDLNGDPLVDQDLSVLGFAAKARGKIAHRADRGVAGAFGKTDLAECCVALRYAGAKAKHAATPPPTR